MKRQKPLSGFIEKFNDGRDYCRRTEEGFVLVKDVAEAVQRLRDEFNDSAGDGLWGNEIVDKIFGTFKCQEKEQGKWDVKYVRN